MFMLPKTGQFPQVLEEVSNFEIQRTINMRVRVGQTFTMKESNSYLVFAELFDLLLADRFAWVTQLDPAANRLAVSFVRQSEHGGRVHQRMREEHLLDLFRVDVLASLDDHLLRSADQLDSTFFVHGGHVAEKRSRK